MTIMLKIYPIFAKLTIFNLLPNTVTSNPSATNPININTALGLAIVVCVVGALGGVVNALISDNGFLFPKSDKTPSRQAIWRPGVLGNIVMGLVGALIFWLLNTNFDALGQTPGFTNDIARSVGGALLAGVGGARLLTNQVDKQLLQAAAAAAVTAKPSPEAAATISKVTPAQALIYATNLPKQEDFSG